MHQAPDDSSNPFEIARSRQQQARGDSQFQNQNYKGALISYLAAESVAPDLAETKFRMGLVLSALGRFDEAFEQFNQGIELDPAWPSKSFSLEELFGPGNEESKMALLSRAAEWCRADMRDFERLCVMGLLLHLDRNPKAEVLFNTAQQLGGNGQFAALFRNASSRTASISASAVSDNTKVAQASARP